MAAGIQHETTVAEAGIVLHATVLRHPLHVLHDGGALYLCRQQLHETLHAIEGTLGSLCLHRNAFACHVQKISFIVHFQRLVDDNVDSALLAQHFHVVASGCFDSSCEEFTDCLSFGSVEGDDCLFGQGKLAVLLVQLDWHRYNVDVCTKSHGWAHTQCRRQ